MRAVNVYEVYALPSPPKHLACCDSARCNGGCTSAEPCTVPMRSDLTACRLQILQYAKTRAVLTKIPH